MNRKPGAELFSGWNCTPMVLLLRTTAGNGLPPAVVQAVTTFCRRGSAHEAVRVVPGRQSARLHQVICDVIRAMF